MLAFGVAAQAAEETRWSEILTASRGAVTFYDVAPGETRALLHRFLFAESEEVLAGGERWQRGVDYFIDYDEGTITFARASAPGVPVEVRYEFLPFLQGDVYAAAMQAENEAEVLERLEEESAAGSQLDVTGSKTFTVRAGSDRPADFDQSLRVSVRGAVGDVKVTGEISDQDLPVEEGGATEELEAVDKVSVRVEGRHFAATFGDYDVATADRRFASYERRLTGIKAEAFYPEWEASAFGARARGRFASNEFYGQDGVQGPYQLTAREDEGIVVLPGTVSVWLNGVQLKEGENADYVVDYDLATVTFTVKRPIRAEDRVVVDFQYTTDEYRRNFYGVEGTWHAAAGATDVSAVYLAEEDERTDDLFGLTPAQRDKLLPVVGDDAERARVFARDENGEVIYEYVGEGNGEYEREWDPVAGRYNYRYVGRGRGAYMPRTILLPLPKRQRLLDVKASATPAAVVSLAAEGAASDYDANTFSPLGDGDNAGLAGAATTVLRLHTVGPLRRVGELEVRHSVETRDERFKGLGREDEVAFLEDWDLADEAAGLARPPAYHLYESTVTERPVSSLELSATYGALSQRYVTASAGGYGDQYATRINAALIWEPDNLPHVAYKFNGVRRRGQRVLPPPEEDEFIPKFFLTRDEARRKEHTGEVSYAFWRFTPYGRVWDREKRSDYATDGVADDGTRDRELEVGTAFHPGAGWNLRYGHTFGQGEEVEDGHFAPSYVMAEDAATASYDEPGLINASAEYTKSRKDFVSAKEQDVTSDLSLVDVYFTPWAQALTTKTRYQLNNLIENEREEIFEVAPDGDGDYRRERDPKNPNRYIYIYDPEAPDAIYIKKYRNTGRTFRVLKPDLAATLALQPYRFNDARGGERARLLDLAAWEVYLAARQSSLSRNRLAAALLQGLLGPDVLASYLEQRYTVNLFPVSRKFTALARYTKTDELDRTIAARAERFWRTSRYAEVTTELAPAWTVEVDGELVRERKTITEENVPLPEDTRARETILGVTPAFTPAPPWEFKFRAEASDRREDYNGARTRIKGLKLKPEVTYRLASSGVVNLWYERSRYDVTGYAGSETLLYRLPGVTHKWQASVNKGVGQYVTVILTYDGEKEPGEEFANHRGQVDLNVYF